MSEKKAPDNKREKEKERLIHVTEEQLQAGKAEIMKIVAGLNGAEKLGVGLVNTFIGRNVERPMN